MPTFDNGDTGLSIRTKLNSVITKVENDGFTSKSSFVTWAATASPSAGDVVTVDGLSYEYDGVSSDDDELVGWKVLGGRSASLSELRNAVAEFNGGEGARLVAPDVALVGDSSQASWSASPAIVGLRPEGYVLSTDLIGTTSELTSDGGARVKQAIDDCMANGWGLLFNPIRDGSPWEWRYIDHTLTADLHIHFHKDALIKPTLNFQQFATSGSTGPYVITDFDYDPVAEGKLSAMLVDTSTTPHTDTKLNQDEDFTVALNGSNYEVTLSATPGANTTLSVSSRKDALGFRETTPGNGRRLLLTGTMSFDISRYGYATASAAGSALSTINIDRFMIDTIIAKGSTASNWMADPLDRRGDAAFAPIWFEHGYVNRVESYDLNDLAIYASGGGNTNDVDDGRFLHVNSIVAERCTNAFKAVRQLGSVVVDNIHAYECSNVVLQGLTNEIPVGQDFTFNSIQGRRIANRVISWADGSLGGAHFGSVEVTDWGYLPDEVTQYTNSAAVFIAQSAGVQIDYLKAAQKDFPVPPDRPVVQISGQNNYGNRILSGYVVGYDVGIRETGGTTNDTGNSFTLTMKDVAEPLDLPGSSDTFYDLVVLTETGGTITSERLVSDLVKASDMAGAITDAINSVETVVASEDTFIPTIAFATPGATGNVSYGTNQAGILKRLNDLVWFGFDIDADFTVGDASGRIRLYFDDSGFTASATPGAPGQIKMTEFENFVNLPEGANNLRWIVAGGQQYAELAFDTPIPLYSINTYTTVTRFSEGELVSAVGGGSGRIEKILFEDIGGTAAIDQRLLISSFDGNFGNETLTGNAGGEATVGAVETLSSNGGTAFVTADMIVGGPVRIRAGLDPVAV